MLAAVFLRGCDAFSLLADSFNPQNRMLDGFGSLFVDVECGGAPWLAAALADFRRGFAGCQEAACRNASGMGCA